MFCKGAPGILLFFPVSYTDTDKPVISTFVIFRFEEGLRCNYQIIKGT